MPARHKTVSLPNRNPNGINPALLTFSEYFKLTTTKTEFHNESSYDISLEKLNSYLPKSRYPKLYRTIKKDGLFFEIRIMEEPTEWGIGVFNKDTKVAAVQDEWGCLLVTVAQEYRGLGLGPMLVKLARTIEPDRPSGGFTPSGYNNFIKVYQSMVRDALASGLYRRLITQGQMTMARAKEIIASAKLPKQKHKPERNLNSNDPKSWLLYVGEYGDFVLYDKKLKTLIDEDREHNDHWIDQMIKGFAYVQLHEGRQENWAMLRQFGGDTPKIKTFLINCAVQYTNDAGIPLWLEPDEIDFIDQRMISRLEGPSLVRGFKSYKVIPTGERFDYNGLGLIEKRWRKSFDQYDEFFHQMIECAHGKFHYQPSSSGE